MADKNNKHDDATTFGGAVAGSELASTEAAASDELRKGMERFLDASDSKVDARWLKGNLFEYIEAAKFNADAARKGVDLEAVVTAADGRPTDLPDIEITRKSDGAIVDRVQAKAGGRNYEAYGLSDPRYDGMTKIVPKDHVKGVQETRDWLPKRTDPRNYKDTADRVKGELECEGASSGGTTSGELTRATNSPKSYASRLELQQTGREIAVTARNAAAAGAVMAGAMSLVRNVLAYFDGHIDGKGAAKNVATDTVTSGVRSGATGAVGAVIRNVASKAGVRVVAKSNVATAVAAGLIDAGVTVYSYAKGEISVKEASERLGNTGCSTASSIGIGAAAGSAFGPVGSVVGAISGYLLTTHVYQSCVAVVNGARLAKDEAERAMALCRQAVQDMDERRRHFEIALAAYLGKRQAIFDQSFAAIDHALVTNQPDDAVRALGDLLTACGQRLQFGSFRDFDRFMTTCEKPLVI